MLVADRYRLDAAIGRGGMGEVWRAVDEVLGRSVAVKLLLGNDGDEQATARFRLEAQTAARLNHPHVVTVFDFGAWNGRLYLVMELVEGVSLAQGLASGSVFTPPQVADIASQAAAGLAAAHRQGVIHRDIKPGNLMQDSYGTVKIGDFGIARFVDDPSSALTSTGQIVGTTLYLAPERALGRPAGPGSDVYALGCVLYQLLVGEPPFQADTLTAVLHQHVDAAPTHPSLRRPEVPDPFGHYLLRMLAKQPEERPSAQEVADWFAGPAWRGGGAPAAPAPGPPPEEPGAATVYALPRSRSAASPAAAGSRRRSPQGRRRTVPQAGPPSRELWMHIRGHLRRHKTLTTAVAGTAAFVATALLGMVWFSPAHDDSGAQPADTPSQGANLDPAHPGFLPQAVSPTTVPDGTHQNPVEGGKAKGHAD